MQQTQEVYAERWDAMLKAFRRFEEENAPLDISFYHFGRLRCAAGWLVQDPDVRALGLDASASGAIPEYQGRGGSYGVTWWLGVRPSWGLPSLGAKVTCSFNGSPVHYGKTSARHVTSRDVIERMEGLHAEWLAEQEPAAA